ncbi:MAG TPA: hypothetical protein VH209_03390 [Steroidobacteraceae bacterium]|nr:hypothetical protein [Steroidobacteraceae bacterium]
MSRILCGAATLILATSVASADVTVENRVAVTGVGIMSAGNMSGTTKTTISGERLRTDSDIQLQSRLVRMLAHGAVGPTAEIVRLDADKIDRLDLNKKQYTEQTFEELRARLQQALDKAQEKDSKDPGPQEGQKPMDDSKCEWLDPKVDVRRSGEKATYAGYEAERLTITASQPCKDKETGAICEVALSLDEWLAPSLSANTEAEKFHRAYAQKLGLDLTSGHGGYGGGGDINQRAQAMFGRYQGIWSQISAKTKDLKGYPVRTTFAFAFGGEQCKNAQQPPPSQNSDNSAASTPTTPGGLAGQMAGKLGSIFHRKKDDAPAAPASTDPATPAAAPALPDGLVPLITMNSELVSISTAGVSADLFEVPADFKKTEPRSR